MRLGSSADCIWKIERFLYGMAIDRTGGKIFLSDYDIKRIVDIQINKMIQLEYLNRYVNLFCQFLYVGISKTNY